MNISNRLYIPVYVSTLLLSAFLLFLIQPMFGKMILPLLGGSPSVWNAAMLFFQVTLLAGYAYAHGIAHFMSIKIQILLHIFLLLVFTVVLPIAIPEGWAPPTGKDPTLWQLILMSVAVGGPFFVLSASAPLLQHWFSHTNHPDAGNPYFLYAASNLGSMTALLIYPFLIESTLNISEQSLSWSWGYGLLIIFVALSALLVWSTKAPSEKNPAQDSKNEAPITWKRRGLWLVLAFVPSSLMLGVTTFITTDLASAPLLWIIPLALYVGTFIIAFAKKPLISLQKTYSVQGILFIMILSTMMGLGVISKPILIITHLLLFFFTALMCHHELSASRPHAGRLTQFYLIMSLGGAMGGFFNAIIAPHLFVVPLEYGLTLALACLIRGINDPKQSLPVAWSWFKDKLSKRNKGFIKATGLLSILIVFLASAASLQAQDMISLHIILILISLAILTINLERRWVFGLCALIILSFHPPGFFWGGTMFDDVIHRDRNFFGVVRIMDSKEQGLRTLLNGTTTHGTQPLAAKYKHMQLSYYSKNSGFTEAFDLAHNPGPQKVAALGLGVGVVSCYQKEGRHFDFFEIDSKIIKIAEDPKLFTYLSDCGSPYKIIQGDARLKLKEQPDNYYDIILVDAFSSDSIPVHLLTLEAFELYKRKLKKGGQIIVHISNRYLNLKPVVAGAAHAIDMQAYGKLSPPGKIEGFAFYATDLMVLTKAPPDGEFLKDRGWEKIDKDSSFRLWTDQYSSIIPLFKRF